MLKTLDVLELLAYVDRPLGAAEVASHLRFSRNVAFRILTTLKSRGYVRQDEESHKYGLGLQIIYLGSAVPESKGLRQLALPFLRELRDQYQETANLVVPDGASILYIERLDSPHILRLCAEIGTRHPVHGTALGKAILSHLSPEKIDALLGPGPYPQLAENTITDRRRLLAELEQVRMRGYALDREERAAGVSCVGAALLDSAGNPIGAVSLSGPTERMMEHVDQNEIGRSVSAAAQEISRLLGWEPGSS